MNIKLLVTLPLIALALIFGSAKYADVKYSNTSTSTPDTVLLGDNGIRPLDQFTSTTSPISAITQKEYGKAIRITGLENCNTIDTDANGVMVCGTDATGGGGSSFAFPFTINSWGNSTSTTLGFLNGFLSTASSTISSALRLSSLGQGFLYTGSNGLVQPIASSSINLSWFNNDAGFLTSYTSPYEIATGTISVPQLAYFTKTGGRTTLGGVSTTTVSCSGSTSCSSFTVIGSSPVTITSTSGASTTLLSDTNYWTGANTFNANLTANGLLFLNNNGTVSSPTINIGSGSPNGFWSPASTETGLTSNAFRLYRTSDNTETITLTPSSGNGSFTGNLSANNLSGTNTGDQDLSGLVPYTGATTNVDLGSNGLTTSGTLTLSALSDGCLSVTIGVVGSVTCGGGGGSSAYEIATTSGLSISQLPYYTKTSGRTTIGGVSTTTLTLSAFPASLSGTLGSLVGGSNTTWTWWGLSTTSQPSSSNLLVSDGSSGVYGVATGTISSGTGISLDNSTRSVIGGSLQITNSSPLSGLSTSFPLSFSNPTLSWIGLATSSGLTNGRVHYSTGVNTFADVATSSIANGTGITVTNGSSAFVIGSQPTINCNTASASVFGCLSASDFSKFNSATTTFGSGYATTTLGTLTFSTSTLSFNGLTVGQTIVPTAGALTFTPTITGTLNNSGLTNSTISGISLGSNLANLTATDNSLTFSGTYNGGTARTIGLNLTNISNRSLFTWDGTNLVATGTPQLTIGNLLSTSTLNNSVFLNNWFGIGTSTPKFTLQISSSTAPQLGLTDGVNIGWAFRNAGGNLYISTTSSTTFATTSVTSTLSILSNGWFGIGTSTPSWQNSFVGTTTIQGQLNSLMASTSAGTSLTGYTINWSNGNTQRFTLNGNATFILNATSSNPVDGGKYVVKLCQDGTGSRTVTWTTPANLAWGKGTTTISTTASTATQIGFIYDAIDQRYTAVASTTGTPCKP